jgi:Fic family protein
VRVERVGQRDHARYYLVKDVRVGPRTAKLKKYLGTKAPTSRELAAYERKFALGLEIKATEIAGKLGTEVYNAKYLTKDRIRALEEIRYMAKLSSDILTKSELQAYEEQFEVKYVQGTTAIEGNTLTSGQTADLLLHGIVPKSKTLREINEVQNFKSVKAFRDKYRGRVNLTFIKKLHSLIMHNIDEESAGAFRRTDDIGITGADLHVCPSLLIEDELERITMEYYQRIKKGYHPFEEVVLYHYAFEAIHPFVDGNGRVGRELFNYMLTKKGYPRLIFPGNKRADYVDALRHGNEGRYAEMVSAFADLAISQKIDVLKENIKKILGNDTIKI